MKYLELLNDLKIDTFPIHIWKKKTKEKLSNGEFKMSKNIKSEEYGLEQIVIDEYGQDLGNYLLANNTITKTRKALKKNPNYKQRNIIPKMNDFDMPLIKEFCKRRWETYYNGNPHGWNCFAVNTKQIGIIDIDCELVKDSPFIEMLKDYPYKKSASKSFGKHILFDRRDIPNQPTRRTNKLHKKYGVCENEEAGVEFLNGIWEWSPINDEIENYQKTPLASVPKWLADELISVIISKHNTIEQLNDCPIAQVVEVPIVPNIPQNYPIDIIKENLDDYDTKRLCSVQVCSGIIISFASSQSEEIYQLILEKCRLPEANTRKFSESWVRQRWDSYCPELNQNLHKTFHTKWCKPNMGKSTFDWEAFDEDKDLLLQKKFCKTHKKNFLINDDYKREDARLCYFDEATCLWKQDPKTGIGKSQIHNLLMTDEYNYWKKTMEESIKLMPDSTPVKGYVPEGQPSMEANPEKKMRKSHKICFLRQFHSTNGWTNGTIRKINIMLLYDTSLKQEVQFNLMPKCQKYFQFNNGAYNLATGELEKRTRDMYVTKEGILNYDYPDECDAVVDFEYSEELDKIDKMMKKIHPDPKMLEAFKIWRGYNLTGAINKQIFFIFLGETAGNGKSVTGEIMRDAFPCYVKEIGNDAVDDTAKNDKSLSSLVNKPYRLLYIEEASTFGLKIKRIVGQKVTPVKPLFMEELELIINFKLEMYSNGKIDAKTDEGVLRRGRQLDYGSKFQLDPDEVDEDNHVYLADPDIVSSFSQTRMKIALFRYFAPYAKKYYNGEFDLPDECKTSFKNTNQEDDIWADFMDKNFKFTGDNEDCIGKINIFQLIYNAFGDGTDTGTEYKYKKMSVIKNEFKRRGVKYESQNRFEGVRGYFMGLTKKEKEKDVLSL